MSACSFDIFAVRQNDGIPQLAGKLLEALFDGSQLVQQQIIEHDSSPAHPRARSRGVVRPAGLLPRAAQREGRPRDARDN
jgi:hypothetical protein